MVLLATSSGCPAGDAPERAERSHGSAPIAWTGEAALAQAESDLARGDTRGAAAALARVPRDETFARRREALQARLVAVVLGRFREALVEIDSAMGVEAPEPSAQGAGDGASGAPGSLEALEAVRFDAAEALLSELQALAPGAPDVVEAGALLAARKKKLEEAISRARKTAEEPGDTYCAFPMRTEDIYRQMAMAPIIDRLDEGSYAEARRLLKAKPAPEYDRPKVRSAMRRTLAALNRYEKEMRAAKAAEAAGHRERAARHYARAHKAAEDLPSRRPRDEAAKPAVRLYDALARSAFEKERWADAAAHWSAAWRIRPEDERVTKGLQALDTRARPIFLHAYTERILAPKRTRSTLRQLLKETAPMCEYHIKARRMLEEMARSRR